MSMQTGMNELAKTVTKDDLHSFVFLAKALKGFAITDCPGCELYLYDGYGHATYDTTQDYRERIAGFSMK